MRLWSLIAVLLVCGCAEKEVEAPLDREALKAELRQEILAELALAKHEPQPAAQPVVIAATSDPANPVAEGSEEPAIDEIVHVPPAEEPSAPSAEPVLEPDPTPPAVADSIREEPVVAPPPAEPELPLVEEPSSKGPVSVLRMDIATNVDRAQKQPQGVGTTFTLGQTPQLFVYLAVQNKGDETQVVVEWYRGETRRSQMTLTIGHSIRGWRTWSKVRLGSGDTGKWAVRVLDNAGAILRAVSFEVQP